MKPMLAGNADLTILRYPVFASPKLDGVRGVVVGGRLLSRSLKPIPNAHVMNCFSKPLFNGLDGELIVGSPTAKDAFRATSSSTSRREGTPDAVFYVFDNYLASGTFEQRLAEMNGALLGQLLGVVLPQQLIRDEKELLAYETWALAEGYEGLILRDPAGSYKFGRSTEREGGMLKLKRFQDSEAEVLDVIEEMENTNVKTTNALGDSERSSHKAGMVPKGRAGALAVRDLKTGITFQIGTGMNDIDRSWFWVNRDKVAGKIVKYKSFLIGVKDAPRFPVYLGCREKWDIS